MSDARHTDSNYAHIYSTRNNIFAVKQKVKMKIDACIHMKTAIIMTMMKKMKI